jgi:glycerol 3-phosphatase-1
MSLRKRTINVSDLATVEGLSGAKDATDISQVEGLIPKEFGADAKEVAGSRALLASLDEGDAPWAIVTSGTRPLVEGWLERMRLTHPKHMVVAEDVEEGKPNPACYNLGKARLGLGPEGVALVIEDAPAGVRAGKAAGCRVVGLLTTHSIEQLQEAGADWIVEDMRSVRFAGKDKATTGDLLKIELHQVLVM